MKEPPSIQPDPIPGPDFDVIDQIVENLQNIESFLIRLKSNTKDTKYVDTHLPSILSLRRVLSHQIGHLLDEPYNYSQKKIEALKKENEEIFLQLEGAVGNLENRDHFDKFFAQTMQAIERIDNDLTP